MAAQFLLIAAIVLVGRLDVATFSFQGHEALGWALMGVGLLLGVAASASLGRSLTPYPKPLAAGSLTDRGPYRIVRHPIYSAVIIGMVGVAIRAGSWPGLALALGLVPLFYAKSTFEERHLMERYPGYRNYQQRVPRRLIPRVL